MKRQNKIEHPQSESARQTQFLPPGLKLFIIGFLFITAFGIRLYRINEFPANLSPGRPIHSLLIARGYYFEALKSIPEWQREVARVNEQRQCVSIIVPQFYTLTYFRIDRWSALFYLSLVIQVR